MVAALSILAAVSLTACAAIRIGYALHKPHPTPPEHR